MSDLVLLKSMQDREIFTKYGQILLDIQNLESEWRVILSTIQDYFQTYSDRNTITTDELESYLWHRNPSLKRDAYEFIFSRLREIKISNPDLILDLLGRVLEKHAMAQIAAISSQVISDDRQSGIDEVGIILDEYKSVHNRSRDIEHNVCSTPISQLFIPESDGLRWRLNFLNSRLGPLKSQTLGHFFARPDGGKTSMAVSEATFFAPQVRRVDRPILYLNNEEAITRVKMWAVSAMLGVSLEWIYSNIAEAEAIWEKQNGEGIKFIGDVNRIEEVEKFIQAFNPRIVFIDQGAKVQIATPKSMPAPLVYQKLYANYRQFGTKYDTSIITLGQADDASTNRKYLGISNLDQSKVGIPGELDYLVGIGFVDDPKYEGIRWLNIAKNKLNGRRGRATILIKSVELEKNRRIYTSRFMDAPDELEEPV